MVAGMIMPLDNLKAIYEHLFRHGVMVAKKDKRPQTKHPEIPGVDNLHVIRAMGSLKSRGYVRETFTWRHYYWYLTNEGIVYLRDYLHLPAEIVPMPLQRVQRPAATLAIARRAERVQVVQGPTSYVPKPGRMGAENQEALLDRQEYRRKMASMDEAEMTESNERTPRFRGRPMASAQIRPRESKEQPMLSDTRDYTREMQPSVSRKVAMHSVSQMPPIETYHAKPVEQEKMVELKECTKTAFVQKSQKVHVSQDVPTISSNVGATAAESSLFSVHTEAVKEKPKEEVSIKVSREASSTAAGESKPAKDARHPTPSKPKVEKTQKTPVMKNVQDLPAVPSAVESSVFSVHTEPVKEKPKEEVFVKVFQQTTSTETAKDAPQPTDSKPKVEKTQKTTVAKNVHQQASSTVEATSGDSSVSAVLTEAAKEKPKEEVFINISKKTTSTVADNSKMAKNAPRPTPSESKVEKTQQTLVTKNVPAVSSAVETTAVKSSVSTEAVKEKPKDEVCIKVSQITSKTDKDSKSDKDAFHPIPLKPKVEKTQKTTKTKNVQDVPTVEATAVQSTIFPAEAAEEKPKEEVETTPKGDSKIDKDATRPTLSKSKVAKTQQAPVSKNMQDVATVSPAVETTAVKSSVSAKAVEGKPKEGMCVSVSQETTHKGDGKIDKYASHLTASKPKAEKTTKTKNVQDIPNVLSTVEATKVESSVFSVSAEAVKEKPKEDVFMKVSQETVFTVTDDSKMANDAPHPTPSKPKVETMLKNTKTKNVQDIPTVLSTAVQSSAVSVSTEAVKVKTKEDVSINVSVETTPTIDSKTHKDAPHPSPSKPTVEKAHKTVLTKNVQEQAIKTDVTNQTSIAPHDVPGVHADETKSTTSISTQVPVKSLESAAPPLPKKEEDLSKHIAEKKSEINLPLQVSVEKTAVLPTASSTVQMIDKQQKALGSQKTKDVQEAPKDDNTRPSKVHEKVEIPRAISTAEVKTEVKSHKPDLSPESQSPSTAAEIKITTAGKIQITDSDSVQQKPSPAKLTEEPVVTTAAKDGDTEDTSKPSKGKKKRQKSANKTSAAKQVPPPIAETKVKEVKTENAGQVDLLKVEGPTNDSAKTSPKGMHAVESVQPTAVQNEAPAHKGEVEPVQPSPEKREVLKGKTSSSQRQWEAPAASASAAAASAQLNPLPEQGEPPSIAQHTPAPDTQQSLEKQSRLSDSKAPAQPVNTGPENTCDAQEQSLDDDMRKKIVVVEEVIEVQQIASPVADQPVTPPVTEITGEDLDYDVLEELAIERGLLQGLVEETDWDHSLQEPEEKAFPNFVEGMSPFHESFFNVL